MASPPPIFHQNDRVLACYSHDGLWYEGHIFQHRLEGNNYKIQFDGYDGIEIVHETMIAPYLTHAAGEKETLLEKHPPLEHNTRTSTQRTKKNSKRNRSNRKNRKSNKSNSSNNNKCTTTTFSRIIILCCFGVAVLLVMYLLSHVVHFQHHQNNIIIKTSDHAQHDVHLDRLDLVTTAKNGRKNMERKRVWSLHGAATAAKNWITAKVTSDDGGGIGRQGLCLTDNMIGQSSNQIITIANALRLIKEIKERKEMEKENYYFDVPMLLHLCPSAEATLKRFYDLSTLCKRGVVWVVLFFHLIFCCCGQQHLSLSLLFLTHLEKFFSPFFTLSHNQNLYIQKKITQQALFHGIRIVFVHQSINLHISFITMDVLHMMDTIRCLMQKYFHFVKI